MAGAGPLDGFQFDPPPQRARRPTARASGTGKGTKNEDDDGGVPPYDATIPEDAPPPKTSMTIWWGPAGREVTFGVYGNHTDKTPAQDTDDDEDADGASIDKPPPPPPPPPRSTNGEEDTDVDFGVDGGESFGEWLDTPWGEIDPHSDWRLIGWGPDLDLGPMFAGSDDDSGSAGPQDNPEDPTLAEIPAPVDKPCKTRKKTS